jgi:hypothetical protein
MGIEPVTPINWRQQPPVPGGCRCGNCLTLSGGLEMVIWFDPQMGVADTIMTHKQGVVDLIWQNKILSLNLNPTVYIHYETT